MRTIQYVLALRQKAVIKFLVTELIARVMKLELQMWYCITCHKFLMIKIEG